MTIGQMELSHEALAALCAKWRIRRLALFGSVLRGDMRPDSDVDLLVDFEPGEKWSLLQLATAEQEFGRLFGRKVDLVDRASLARSQNPYRRDAILESAEVVYGA